MNTFGSESLGIILGAGASHDCGAHVVEAPDKRVPLAKDVLGESFDDVLCCFPQLDRRKDELRARLAKGENLEAVLRDFYDSARANQKFWPFQIPLYLRQLFWAISQDYMHGSTKVDTLMRRTLASAYRRVMFLSLNYDLFLDEAIMGYERVHLSDMDSYIAAEKKWILIKPHGSVDWARAIDNCPRGGPGEFWPTQLNDTPHYSAENPSVVMWNRALNVYYRPSYPPGDYMHPQLVIPADSPKEFACPAAHIEAARGFHGGCSNLIVIGFSGRDEHIARLLGFMPDRSHITIVGKGQGDAKSVMDTIFARVPDLVPKKFDAEFYDDGFSEFVMSDSFGQQVG